MVILAIHHQFNRNKQSQWGADKDGEHGWWMKKINLLMI